MINSYGTWNRFYKVTTLYTFQNGTIDSSSIELVSYDMTNGHTLLVRHHIRSFPSKHKRGFVLTVYITVFVFVVVCLSARALALFD